MRTNQRSTFFLSYFTNSIHPNTYKNWNFATMPLLANLSNSFKNSEVKMVNYYRRKSAIFRKSSIEMTLTNIVWNGCANPEFRAWTNLHICVSTFQISFLEEPKGWCDCWTRNSSWHISDWGLKPRKSFWIYPYYRGTESTSCK